MNISKRVGLMGLVAGALVQAAPVAKPVAKHQQKQAVVVQKHTSKPAVHAPVKKHVMVQPASVPAHKMAAVQKPVGAHGHNHTCTHEHGAFAWHAALGYGVTQKTGITNPDANYWDAATETDGYNADLGHTSFVQLGVDKILKHDCKFGCTYQVGLEMNIMQDMHYNKYQQGAVVGGSGTGANRMRFFDVSHMSMLAHGKITAKEFSNRLGCVAPVIDLGLGFGVNQVSGFKTVGYESSNSVGTTTSLGEKARTSIGLAGALGVGVQFKPADVKHTSFHLGYRYYWGGGFQTPERIMINTASYEGKLDTVSKAWKGTIAMHQFVFGLELEF